MEGRIATTMTVNEKTSRTDNPRGRLGLFMASSSLTFGSIVHLRMDGTAGGKRTVRGANCISANSFASLAREAGGGCLEIGKHLWRLVTNSGLSGVEGGFFGGKIDKMS